MKCKSQTALIIRILVPCTSTLHIFFRIIFTPRCLSDFRVRSLCAHIWCTPEKQQRPPEAHKNQYTQQSIENDSHFAHSKYRNVSERTHTIFTRVMHKYWHRIQRAHLPDHVCQIRSSMWKSFARSSCTPTATEQAHASIVHQAY